MRADTAISTPLLVCGFGHFVFHESLLGKPRGNRDYAMAHKRCA